MKTTRSLVNGTAFILISISIIIAASILISRCNRMTATVSTESQSATITTIDPDTTDVALPKSKAIKGKKKQKQPTVYPQRSPLDEPVW